MAHSDAQHNEQNALPWWRSAYPSASYAVTADDPNFKSIMIHREIPPAEPAQKGDLNMPRGVRSEIEGGKLHRFAELYNGGASALDIKEELGLTQSEYRRYFQEAKHIKAIKGKDPVQVVAAESWEAAGGVTVEPDPGEVPPDAVDPTADAALIPPGDELAAPPSSLGNPIEPDDDQAPALSSPAADEVEPAHVSPMFEEMPRPIDWRERCRQEYAKAEIRLECARRAEEATEAVRRIYGDGADDLFRAVWYQYLRELQDLDIAG